MEQLMKGQRVGKIFASAGAIVAAINSGYRAIIKTPNGSTEVAAIVRCKDCINGIKVKNGAGEDAIMCEIDLEPHCYPLDWFCADGERE